MPTVYKSSDTSAPVLTGQVGTLIALLDACLVNGYGSKTAAGWTKPFTGTNAGSYLQGGTGGMYLDVNDNAAGTAGAQEATVRGYEAMTALATGTNPFPTTFQIASPGMFIRKSATADATARGWVLLADSRTFHLFVLSGDTAGRYQSFSFGDIFSFQSADAYKTIIVTHAGTNNNNAGLDATSFGANATSGTSGTYQPRIYNGTGTSNNATLSGVGSTLIGAPFTGPNPEDGNIYISRVFVGNSTVAAGLRGYLRGVYQILTAVGLNDGDTFSGTGDFAGKTFTILNRTVNGGYYALETSTWDTST